VQPVAAVKVTSCGSAAMHKLAQLWACFKGLEVRGSAPCITRCITGLATLQQCLLVCTETL
jgi:hypothetical protein